MAFEVIMPKAGMAMETGTIIQWFKQPGDAISVGEPLLEIETDKVAMEVEAEQSGTLLAVLRDAGDVVPVTETIGWIGVEGEAVPAAGKAATGGGSAAPTAEAPGSAPGAHADAGAEPAGREGSGAVPTGGGGPAAAATGAVRPAADADPRPRATPAARHTAGALQVDLSRVRGTGPSGEILLADVTATAAAAPGAPSRISPLAARDAGALGVDIDGVSGSGPAGRVLRRDVAEQGGSAINMERALHIPQSEPSDTPVWRSPDDRVYDASRIRQITAARMVESHRRNPPVTLNAVADVTALLGLRADLNRIRNGDGFGKVSLNSFVLRASALAVGGAPWMRSTLEGTQIVEHARTNIGMAVATEAGLLVPVIPDADRRSLLDLDEYARLLAERARLRKLRPDDLQGATFSVTNLGMYGVTTFTPIINPPESAILGVGAVEERPTIAGNQLVSRSVLHLSLTIDHKLIDGAQGAIFLQQLVRYFEEPLRLIAPIG